MKKLTIEVGELGAFVQCRKADCDLVVIDSERRS